MNNEQHLGLQNYDEASSDYREGLPKWKIPLTFRRTAEQEFAIACDKVGKIDEAIKHAKLSGSAELLATLYLKERRFLEAKAIADNEIIDNRISNYDYHSAHGLAPWLQFRAVLECTYCDTSVSCFFHVVSSFAFKRIRSVKTSSNLS